MEQAPLLSMADDALFDIPRPRTEPRLIPVPSAAMRLPVVAVHEPTYPELRREEIIASTRSYHQEARSRLQQRRSATAFLIAVFRQMRAGTPY